MIQTKICAGCSRLLNEAMTAIRYHETDMGNGIKLNLEGYLTEDLRKELAPGLVDSFNRAQAAWDAYREHLIGHGLLKPGSPTANPAT